MSAMYIKREIVYIYIVWDLKVFNGMLDRHALVVVLVSSCTRYYSEKDQAYLVGTDTILNVLSFLPTSQFSSIWLALAADTGLESRPSNPFSGWDVSLIT